MMTIGEVLNRKRVFYLLIKDKNFGDREFDNLEDLVNTCNLTPYELKKATGHFNMPKHFPLRVKSRNDKELSYQVFRIYDLHSHINDCTVYFDA